MTKDIPDRLAAQPFQPFVESTADGREYDVPSHDHAHVSPGGGRIGIWSDDETEYILRALLISGLKATSRSAKRSNPLHEHTQQERFVSTLNLHSRKSILP